MWTAEQLREAVALPIRPLEPPPPRNAAVAAVFEPDLSLILIRRAHRPGDPWSGHLSFPGGHAEVEDPDITATACRETHEELGIALPPSSLLGPLQPLPTAGHLPSLGVYPFVFVLPEPAAARPNHEVASVHRVPLQRLLENDGRTAFQHDWQGRSITLPAVDVDGHRLWGLTLMIIDDLLHRLDGRGQGLARLDPKA